MRMKKCADHRDQDLLGQSLLLNLAHVLMLDVLKSRDIWGKEKIKGVDSYFFRIARRLLLSTSESFYLLSHE